MATASRGKWSLYALFHPISQQPAVDYDLDPEELQGVQTETHVYPRSDQLNDPATVAILLRPTDSALGMVDATFHTRPNIESDGNRIIQDGAQQTFYGNVPFDNAANYTFLAGPNVEGGVPASPQMSVLRQQFEAALERIQNYLIGAP